MSEPIWISTDKSLELEKQISQLTKERDEMKRERDAYDTQINAWYETFETTQLTHAAARLEKAEKDRDRLRTRAEASEAKCAEMREVLTRRNVALCSCKWDGGHESHCNVVAVHHALSDQCGTGWLSPEKKKVLVEALERCMSRLDGTHHNQTLKQAKQALEACK